MNRLAKCGLEISVTSRTYSDLFVHCLKHVIVGMWLANCPRPFQTTVYVKGIN